jgi:hypothetical protein
LSVDYRGAWWNFVGITGRSPGFDFSHRFASSPSSVSSASRMSTDDVCFGSSPDIDAWLKPANQIDVIGEHVEYRRGMRVALENGKGLRS